MFLVLNQTYNFYKNYKLFFSQVLSSEERLSKMKKNLPANEIDPTLIKDLIQFDDIQVDDTEISMIDQEPNTSNKCF